MRKSTSGANSGSRSSFAPAAFATGLGSETRAGRGSEPAVSTRLLGTALRAWALRSASCPKGSGTWAKRFKSAQRESPEASGEGSAALVEAAATGGGFAAGGFGAGAGPGTCEEGAGDSAGAASTGGAGAENVCRLRYNTPPTPTANSGNSQALFFSTKDTLTSGHKNEITKNEILAGTFRRSLPTQAHRLQQGIHAGQYLHGAVELVGRA